ncbi:MAG TPA: hypothetical protein VFT79_11445 [Solirubrobacterales bacterium]|nr:hypothetical protein [Solirubrobacterales bacterium]
MATQATKRRSKSTSPATRGQAKTPLTAGTAPETKIVFGLVFDLRGTLIPVSTTGLEEAKKNGVELTLPAPVNLGSFEDFSAWFKKQFNVEIPKASELPEPLGKILGKLESLEVTVTRAHIKIPPEVEGQKEREATLYTLELSAAWPKSKGGIELIPGVLEIQGAMFGVSNEPKKPAA